MPYFDPSRPMPDSLTPPNGATSVEIDAGVDADDAVLQRLRRRARPGHVAAVEVAGQAVRRVVGHADRLVLGREAADAGDRPERLLVAPSPSSSVTSGEHRRLEELPAALVPLAAERAPRAPWSTRVGDVALDLLERRPSISGPTLTPSVEAVADHRAPRRRRRSARRTRRRPRPGPGCGWREMQVWPELRYLRRQRAGDRRVEVGVVEDDERRVAAELERDLLDLSGALAPSAACRPRSSPVKPSLRTSGLRGQLARRSPARPRRRR